MNLNKDIVPKYNTSGQPNIYFYLKQTSNKVNDA